jgi:hypothetical protein
VATLIELIDDLADRKLAVLLAACPLKLIDMMERMPRGPEIVANNVYPTISDAIGQVQCLRTADGDETEAATRKIAWPPVAGGGPAAQQFRSDETPAGNDSVLDVP